MEGMAHAGTVGEHLTGLDRLSPNGVVSGMTKHQERGQRVEPRGAIAQYNSTPALNRRAVLTLAASVRAAGV